MSLHLDFQATSRVFDKFIVEGQAIVKSCSEPVSELHRHFRPALNCMSPSVMLHLCDQEDVCEGEEERGAERKHHQCILDGVLCFSQRGVIGFRVPH